ncbi:MAG: hypothetical protein ACFFCO_01440 [Promethearchaeota archaeon]
MKSKNGLAKASSWTRRMLRDPVTRLLQEQSNLTHVQLETMLIDFLMDGFGGEQLDYETKATLRRTSAKIKPVGGVSRGAFNRSLAQARKNVIKSIFTLILMGYLGLFESPSLKRYQDLAETIRSYAKDYDQAASKEGELTTTHKRAVKQAQARILALIERFINPLSLKPE